MGNQSPELQLFLKIQKLINSSRFNESFLMLKNQLKRYDSLQRDLEALRKSEDTYKFMLDYISEGNLDPSQKEVIQQIRGDLQRANDIVYRESLLSISPDLYSSTRRMEILKNRTFKSHYDNFLLTLKEDTSQDNNDKAVKSGGIEKISPEQANALDALFNYIWTAGRLSQEEIEEINASLNDPALPEYYKSLVISAIILGNISFFDSGSFEILLNQYESTDSLNIKAKAIVGIILISLIYPQKITGNLNIRSRLLLSLDDEELKKIINEVLFTIVKTYDTNRIDSKMRNEVIPGLMKIKPEIIDKIRNISTESEDFLSDENPNWEELIENSEIGEKLKEINDLQLEGADVMVTAFSNLKSFPFFNSVSNWFLPFVPHHYIFDNILRDREQTLLSRLNIVMCDSDIHSFLLSLGSMPESNRTQMFANIENQMKMAQEAMSGIYEQTDDQILSKKIRQSLQDLYRFFKFYRRKSEFNDPFASPVLASQIETLLPLFDFNTDNIKVIGDFYLKNKYYDEAGGLFELVDQLQGGNFNFWEKIGYCHDRMRRFDKASEWYKKSELVNPSNPWLIKKLAIALKNAGKPDEAIEYYKKALSNEPENYHLLMSAAQTYLEAGNKEEALQHFYHAQYLEPTKLAPQRAIAWTELIAGNYDKAKIQYHKLLNLPEANKTDFLNTAHCFLASADFKNALSYYKSFINKIENKDITELVIALREDADILKEIGIKTQDLRLIIDKIRYDLFP